MKKFLIMFLLAVLAAGPAMATVLFPFFNDLSTDYKQIVRLTDNGEEQVMYRGGSSWGGLKDCMGFLDDVVPDDVTKLGVNDSLVVYLSPFHKKELDTLPTGANKVCAIYLVNRGASTLVFYTESSAAQQKVWQKEIGEGKFDGLTEPSATGAAQN